MAAPIVRLSKGPDTFLLPRRVALKLSRENFRLEQKIPIINWGYDDVGLGGKRRSEEASSNE